MAVTFSSANHAGTGVTDGIGNYQLGNGAESGENKVAFTVVDSVDGDEDSGDTDTGVEEDEGEEESQTDSVIPAKYGNPETSGMTFSVPEGGSTSANFDLTSE